VTAAASLPYDRLTSDELGDEDERLPFGPDAEDEAEAPEPPVEAPEPPRCSLCSDPAADGSDKCAFHIEHEAAAATRAIDNRSGEAWLQQHAETERQLAEQHARIQAHFAAEEAERQRLDAPRCPGGCGRGRLPREAATMCEQCIEGRRAERAVREMVAGWRCRLPRQYRELVFGSDALAARVRDGTAIPRALAACTPTTQRILLVGAAGVGKSSLAAASYMALGVARGDGHGCYVHAKQLAVARSQHELGSEAPIIADAMSADVCIVDDVGVEPTDARGSAVSDLIYERYNRALPTIYTTSLTPKNVVDLYGDGCKRRLYEGVADSFVIAMTLGKGAAR
jgi:hypothetical protein